MPYAPEHDEETAAETIRRWSEKPGGVLVQTTHWRSIGVQSALYWGGLGMLIVFVMLDGFAPSDASQAERMGRLATIIGGAVPVALWWLFIRNRVGVVVQDGTLVARRLIRRSIRLDPAQALDPIPVSPWGRRSIVASGRGFLLPGSKRFAVPGLRAQSKAMTDLRACRLIIRPARPWYRLAARPGIPREVVWRSDSTGRDALIAIGFDIEPDPETEPKVVVGRPGESASERLTRWNRDAA